MECAVEGPAEAGAAADYVLARADRPAAFGRGDYYLAEDGDSDHPTTWHGDPRALMQLGVAAGTPVDRDDLIAAPRGQHAATGEQIRPRGWRAVERDGEEVRERREVGRL